jgi:hypothetical protein
VYVYVDINYGGLCLKLTSDVADLGWYLFPGGGGSWDNNLSSIRLLGGYEATLYESYSYAGTSEAFFADDTFVATSAGNALANDTVSSIEVIGPS